MATENQPNNNPVQTTETKPPKLVLASDGGLVTELELASYEARLTEAKLQKEIELEARRKLLENQSK